MIPLKLRFSPIYSLTFSSRKSVNCKPGRKVVKHIVNIRKIINLLFTSFTFFSKCMSLEYAKLQSQITDQKMPRSGMNRPKISIVLLTHVNLPYKFFFQKNFQPVIVYSIRSHSVKFIRNASYINRKGLSCLLR